MRFPKSLPEGGTIGFAAPSFGCATEPYKSCFDAALDKWHKDGYKTKLGPNCYAADGIGISSTPESCGRELTDMYLDKESGILLSCGGGELMCEILDHVDFDRIREAEPKWYMGYSDNTNFTFTLATICDTAAIYGPCANEYGMSRHHQSLIDAWNILTDPVNRLETGTSGDVVSYEFSGYGMWEKCDGRDEEHPYVPYNLTEKTVLHRFIGDGKPLPVDPAGRCEPDSIEMSGRLLGGCLDCLVNLCGTRYDQVSQFNEKYASDGVLWFIEACDLNVMSIRRAMWELEHAGWFDKTSGFIIGRPLHFDEPMMGLDQYMAVYDIVSHHRVPILMDADLGHLSPMVPLITGSYATVQAEGNEWNVRMELR
ncbi:Muramoyltetrapeptide carboxypeptidase LdcA (peptidoglycan recycling) [Lachnospiraceae bacterium XBB2008]|nr:Muramoyltetrapeptide carboxypeptidase LdcA (peptidoglycan recycling) [Lachnospiraceae bacterium XBB2008]